MSSVKLDADYKVFLICSQPGVAENFVKIARCLQINEKIKCTIFATGAAYPISLKEASNQIPRLPKIEVQQYDFESLKRGDLSKKNIKNVAKQIAEHFSKAESILIESGLGISSCFLKKTYKIFSKKYPEVKQLFFSPDENDFFVPLKNILNHFHWQLPVPRKASLKRKRAFIEKADEGCTGPVDKNKSHAWPDTLPCIARQSLPKQPRNTEGGAWPPRIPIDIDCDLPTEVIIIDDPIPSPQEKEKAGDAFLL